MKPSAIFTKTLKFVWIKLGLGFAKFLISVILLAIFGGIGLATKSGGVLAVMFVIWLALTSTASVLLDRYLGYMVTAGHIAVITQAVSTGTLPENQLQFAKQAVTSRFATANVYFVVSRLVDGAVRQLQGGVDKLDNIFGNIPGLSAIFSFIKIFIGIALGYVDDCCLAYTFLNPQQGACKSAADGVVIYFQNWKSLMKNAALLSLAVMGLFLVAAILPMLLFVGIAAAAGAGTFGYTVAVVLAMFIAAIVKTSFIDSYIMTKMIASYIEVAPSTVITFDLYDKLCKLSRKFRKLFEKGQAEAPVAYAAPAAAAAGAAPFAPAAPAAPVTSAPAVKYCPNCGTQLAADAAFCTGCGNSLQ